MKEKKFQIFAAGSHTTMDGKALKFTTRDLQTIAVAFARHIRPAPLVLGHPKTDSPAMGWVKSLSAKGDRLYATAEFSEELVDHVKAKRYVSVSSAFLPPEDVRNPRPGSWYLRHVGFLGAMTPAVKGMEPVEFAEVGLGSFQENHSEPVIGLSQQIEVAFSEAKSSHADPHSQERQVLHKMAQLLMKNSPGMSYAAAALEADRQIKDHKERHAKGNNFDRERVAFHESILDIQMSEPGLSYAGAAHKFFSR